MQSTLLLFSNPLFFIFRKSGSVEKNYDVARADVYVTNQRRHWRCLGGEVKVFVSKAVFIILWWLLQSVNKFSPGVWSGSLGLLYIKTKMLSFHWKRFLFLQKHFLEFRNLFVLSEESLGASL